MSTTEATIDVTQAVQVLAAAAEAGMVDPTKTPESDGDKIEQATKVLTLALQVKGVVDIVGKSKVPKWPDAEKVLNAAGMLDGPPEPPAADLTPEPVPEAHPQEFSGEPDGTVAAPSADEPEGPSPTMSREQAERAADEAEAGMDDQDGVTWSGREGFIREMAGMDGARPLEGEWWVNDAGSRFLVLRYGVGPTMEIRFAGSQEKTDVPAGYAMKLSARQEDDEPVPPPPALDASHNPTPAQDDAADAQSTSPSVDVAEKLRLAEEKRASDERAARQAAVDAAQAQAESEPVEDPGPPTADEEAEAKAAEKEELEAAAPPAAPEPVAPPEPPAAEPVGSTGVAPAPEPDMVEEEIAAKLERAADERQDTSNAVPGTGGTQFFHNQGPPEPAPQAKPRLEYTKVDVPPVDSPTWNLGIVRDTSGGKFVFCDEDSTYWDFTPQEPGYDHKSNYTDEVEVHNDEGDEVYRKVLDEAIKVYSPNGMPIPLSLQNPPEAMPDDLTKIGDLENRRLHSQFNALSARAKYQHDIEAAIARKCKLLRDKEMKTAIRAARAEHGGQKDIVYTEIENYAEEAESVVLWAERQAEHEERAKAYKTFFDIYSQNVKVLSRDWTMKDTEREG